MKKRVFLLLLAAIFFAFQALAFDYDAYDYDCSFFRAATASAEGQIELLLLRIGRYHEQHKKLPDSLAQLEKTSLGGFETYCWSFDEYYKAGANLKKTSGSRVEVLLKDLEEGIDYQASYRIDGDGHIISYYINGSFISSSRYDKFENHPERLDKDFKYFYDYGDCDGYKIMLSAPKKKSVKCDLVSLMEVRRGELFTRRQKMLGLVLFTVSLFPL